MSADFENHCELAMDSKSIKASCIWFCQDPHCEHGGSREWSKVSATHPVFVLHKALIVSTNCNQELQAVYVFKAVNPFLSFRPLTTNVKHPICENAKLKDSLR